MATLEELESKVATLEAQVAEALQIAAGHGRDHLPQGVDPSQALIVGSGVPAGRASEGTQYWDTANDDLYVNKDGATAWQLIGGASSGGGGGGANTLDQAYDQGGAGAGRTINATAGAVKIQGAAADAMLDIQATGDISPPFRVKGDGTLEMRMGFGSPLASIASETGQVKVTGTGASDVMVNKIAERTAGSGVTVDGLLIKDGRSEAAVPFVFYIPFGFDVQGQTHIAV